ncbi:MAG: hypothetical protein R3C28_15910 [Pirellulaceae bacterium]
MFVGPVFYRELVTAPRRPHLFAIRTVYAAVLFGVMCTAWLLLAGTQVIRGIEDMSRFGAILFQILVPLQMAVVLFMAALTTASAVSLEKDRKTILLLLLTRLNNSELVLGKLAASLIHVYSMILASAPVLAFSMLFGGISLEQVARVLLVTLLGATAAGSLGALFGFWREKTFQTLAMTALVIVVWLVVCEAVASGVCGESIFGQSSNWVAAAMSPMRAVSAAAVADAPSFWQSPVTLHCALVSLLTLALNGTSIARVRIWNPSREIREVKSDETLPTPSATADGSNQADAAAEATQSDPQPYRQVWDNPILWREICTWAYGRKVLIIRLAYLVLFVITTAGLIWASQQLRVADAQEGIIPLAARPLLPLFVVSLVIINALAVTSITSERDGRSLDLLLVTDLRPAEFLFGKLGGIFWITKEMVILPILLCIYLWWNRTLNAEGLVFASCGLLVLDFFVAVLGIHCGMTYASSRSAIGISLGTVFFLFLGIATCILMMISFSGSFQVQIAPFLAFIVGGSIGLFVALGVRNPSPAILLASLVLPFATFYAITSYMLGQPLATFLVSGTAYLFASAAMMIPALAEFDFAAGRSQSTDES